MNINEAIDLLKLLADESRLLIIKQLSKNKKLNGNELLKAVNCKQATLSHHMNLLAEAGLVKAKKKGNKVFYSLENDTLARLTNFLYKADTSSVLAVEQLTKVDMPKQEIKNNKETVKPIAKPIEKKEDVKEELLPTYLL